MEQGEVSTADIQEMIRNGRFSCYLVALKLQGIQEFLEGLDVYTKCPEYGEAFAARVFKISRDEKGNRLTHLKVTGGSLKVKQIIKGKDWEEKADQLRVYDGAGFSAVNEALAGSVCAVNWTSRTFAGECLGAEQMGKEPVLTPVLTCETSFLQAADVHNMLKNIRELEEEEPYCIFYGMSS